MSRRLGMSPGAVQGRNGGPRGEPLEAVTRYGIRKSKHTLAREHAQSGTPAREGWGYCPECYREIPVRGDGTLQSHRPNGYPCVGSYALPYVHTTTEGTAR